MSLDRDDHGPEIEPKQNEPGYVLGFVLIGVLVALLVATFTVSGGLPRNGRGAGNVLGGTYLITIGLMFLGSYYFSHKTFFFRGLLWICEHFSHPRGKEMAIVVFVLATVLGSIAVLEGLGYR